MACGTQHATRGVVTATPVGSDVAALADRVRTARAEGTTLRVVAAGTWLDAGRPCAAAEHLSVRSLSGIVDYEPGDLTLTAKAATSLEEIARVTATQGQWLPLQPMGAAEGTLGATVATASAGPLASAFGMPRDHVLGCEFVSGTGDVVRAGGRVVKNVAGFDLVRLMTGAWGTLGVLTEITVRLRALPEQDLTFVVPLPTRGGADSVQVAWSWLRQSDYTPLAAELLSASLAQGLDVASEPCLLVRLGGNVSFVRAAEDDVATIGDLRRIDSNIWKRLAVQEPAPSIVMRFSTLPSRISSLWALASDACERAGGYAHATISRGVVRCVLPASNDAAANSLLGEMLVGLATGYTAVGERLPATAWDALARTRSTNPLARGVRRAFDPDHIMNAHILGVTS